MVLALALQGRGDTVRERGKHRWPFEVYNKEGCYFKYHIACPTNVYALRLAVWARTTGDG